MTGFARGDVVAYHNPDTTDLHQLANQRQLADRVGLVERVREFGEHPVGVKWTGWCYLDHDPAHLVLIR
jgi:hypothetical protein